MLQWVAKEALWLQNQQYSNEGNNLTTFRDAQSILQTLAEGDGDSEAFSALESESDSEQSVHSNYRNSHDTLDDPEEDDSEHTPTPELTEKLPIIPVERQSKDKTERKLTPAPERLVEKIEERKPNRH